MVGCSILGCQSRSERKIEEITFHKYHISGSELNKTYNFNKTHTFDEDNMKLLYEPKTDRQLQPRQKSSYFIPRYPLDEQLKRKWIEATGRINWQPTKYTKVCSLHFTKDVIDRKPKRVHLKPFSVPTQHIHCINNVTTAILQGEPNDPTNVAMITLSQNTDRVLQDIHNIHPARLNVDFQHTNKITNLIPDECSSKIPESTTALTSTPRKEKILKRALSKEKEKSAKRLKKLHAVREAKRRATKKIASLQNVITELKAKMNMNFEELDLLSNIETENADFLRRFLDKENCPKKYSPSLRKFALCLHFLSPKAYTFVRKQFRTCLPHPKTLYRWYKCIDCEPGFTSESFDAIKIIARKSKNKVLCSLSLDEMSIRQHLQWDGKQTIGYVNIGENLESDNQPLAKDALVFMVTALNDNWKIPVGYFLTAGVNGEQRSALLKNCVNLIVECGVEVASVTFDGCPANFAMAKILGACFDDPNNIKPEIYVEGQKLVIMPDPCHMLKLVRNTLADKKEIYNNKNEKISWSYIEKLHELQQSEGLHLANKLRSAHVQFKKQIMKVRLAAQTFSKSVAEALLFCKNDLEIDDFHDSGATIQFIYNFNDIFDIFNSRRLSTYGFKKPISKENFISINNKLKEFEELVKTLKFAQGELVIKSGRKTGFIGFLTCVESLRIIYHRYINVENAPLKYLCTYKMSQDHLEIFFSAIRSKGGFNNNPTALQFISAYRRLLIHGELKNLTTGNCVPLESINILTCNKNSLCRKFNGRKERLLSLEENLDTDDLKTIDVPETHDYIGNCQMSEFTTEATIYIAGYIIKRMSKLIKCNECLAAISSCNKFNSFISRKDFGGLHYPSEDVIKICLYAEKTIRHVLSVHGHSYFGKKNCLPRLICVILNNFVTSNIFNNLKEHIKEQSALDNHISLLIKAICLRYLEVRIHFKMSSVSQRDERIRSFYNKLILFQGQ